LRSTSTHATSAIPASPAAMTATIAAAVTSSS
jgi:hypothetical protein